MKNNLWAFGSYRYIDDNEDVNAQDTRALLRDGRTRSEAGLRQGHLRATQNDMISFTFLNDPQTRSGSIDATVANSRDPRARAGRQQLLAHLQPGLQDALLLDGGLQQARRRDHRLRGACATVAQHGRFPSDRRAHAGRRAARRLRAGLPGDPSDHAVPWSRRSTSGTEHASRAASSGRSTRTSANLLYLPETDRSAVHVDLSRILARRYTAASIANSTLWSTRQFNVTNASDFNGLIATINTLPNRGRVLLARTTPNGERHDHARRNSAPSLVFNSTAGNPNAQINYYRISESADRPAGSAGPRQGFFVPGRRS